MSTTNLELISIKNKKITEYPLLHTAIQEMISTPFKTHHLLSGDFLLLIGETKQNCYVYYANRRYFMKVQKSKTELQWEYLLSKEKKQSKDTFLIYEVKKSHFYDLPSVSKKQNYNFQRIFCSCSKYTWGAVPERSILVTKQTSFEELGLGIENPIKSSVQNEATITDTTTISELISDKSENQEKTLIVTVTNVHVDHNLESKYLLCLPVKDNFNTTHNYVLGESKDFLTFYKTKRAKLSIQNPNSHKMHSLLQQETPFFLHTYKTKNKNYIIHVTNKKIECLCFSRPIEIIFTKEAKKTKNISISDIFNYLVDGIHTVGKTTGTFLLTVCCYNGYYGAVLLNKSYFKETPDFLKIRKLEQLSLNLVYFHESDILDTKGIDTSELSPNILGERFFYNKDDVANTQKISISATNSDYVIDCEKYSLSKEVKPLEPMIYHETTTNRQIEQLYFNISGVNENLETQTSLKSDFEEKISQLQRAMNKKEATPELNQLKSENHRLQQELKLVKDTEIELTRVEQAIITNFQRDVADYLKGKISLTNKNYIIQQGTKPTNAEEVNIADFKDLDLKLRANLLSFGMNEEYVKGYARFIITSALTQGNFVVSGSHGKEVADSLSYLLTGNSAGEVYLDQGASYGKDLLQEIQNMPDRVILVHHALDTYSESLFHSVTEEVQGKILFFSYDKETGSSTFTMKIEKKVSFIDVDPFWTGENKPTVLTGIFDILTKKPEIEQTSQGIPSELLEILPNSIFNVVTEYLNVQNQIYSNTKITFPLLRSIKFSVKKDNFDRYIENLSGKSILKGLVEKWKL